MWNAHSKVGLSQSLFYVPVIIAACYLLYLRRHVQPLIQWVVLLIFSIVRFGGGILLILFETRPDQVGRIIAATIFEGAGVIPLLLAVILHLLLIRAIDFPDHRPFKLGIVFTRLIFLVGVGLLISGSALIGEYKDENAVKLGVKLARAGYIIIPFVLLLTATWTFVMWFNWQRLTSNSRMVLVAITSSLPFLVVRLVYAVFTVFSADQKWSPLTGAIAPFVIMHSVMEYAVTIICIIAGLRLKGSSLITKGLVASRSQSQA